MWRPELFRAPRVHLRQLPSRGGSVILRVPGARRPGVSSLAITSAVLGVTGSGAYCFFRVVHSDVGEKQDTRSSKGSFKTPLTTLTRTKSIDKFFEARQIEDTERVLREHEQSHVVDAASGITRFDIAQVASNNPTEDDHSEVIIPSSFGAWSVFAVFDGHSGWETSAWLRETLVMTVVSGLVELFFAYGPKARPPAAEIDIEIKKAFKAVDDYIVHEVPEALFQTPSTTASASVESVNSVNTLNPPEDRVEDENAGTVSRPLRTAVVNMLAPALAGSCALLAFYNSEMNLLRVAVTGDSRAVLGRRRADGTFDVKVLSADQTGANPDEQARMAVEHPGETIIQGARVLGWGIARAFGDGRVKWSRDFQTRMVEEGYLGRAPAQNLLTPPYFTAEPVITTTEVEPGDFLIMATDGLWDCLTNEEAVGLVGLWLTQERNSSAAISPGALPVTLGKDGTLRYQQWRAEKQFANADQNAATHLVRNALGGADEDLLSALLSLRSPRARTFTDDITATVIFFR